MGSYKKGFTLLELLVIISIISLLSSVILAATQSAREKATTTALNASFGSINTQINILTSDVEPFDFCSSIQNILDRTSSIVHYTGIKQQNGCVYTGSNWALFVRIDDNYIKCMDSSGAGVARTLYSLGALSGGSCS